MRTELKHKAFRRSSACVLLLFALPAVSSLPAHAQSTVASSSLNTKRIPPNKSADTEADAQVSLSADQIIDLLGKETGLLLQVKKALVRKAYEQGRLLDPQELTDEALFHLIREDVNVRILATREIEDRQYVRAKPTKKEIEDEKLLERQREALFGRTAVQPTGIEEKEIEEKDLLNMTQEERYWYLREREERLRQRPTLPQQRQDQTSPYAPSPTGPDVLPGPQQLSPQDLRRLNQASLGSQDSGEGGQVASRMSRISPEEMPSLLAGAGAGEVSSGEGSGLPQLAARYGAQQGLSSPSDNEASQPQGRTRASGQQAREQASLDMRTRPPLWPPTYKDSETQIRHRADPYANVPSLYDLYSQVSKRPPRLERFGEDVFINGTGNFDELPMDLPVGPEYVIGPGDSLNIQMWGGVSSRLQRVVDRSGRVGLPEVGAILVSGKTLGEVQRDVQAVLRTQYRDVQADVSLSRLRTLRVYVVGDVLRPGAYDVSSLSTPLNALLEAGGPTDRGSLRTLKHYRGKQLVQEVDVYDLILHGVRNDVQHLQPGDTVLVPPVQAQITVEGMVRRPAIYELHGETNLAEVLELSGGVLPTGTLRHIDVERVEAHQKRTMLSLDLPGTNSQQADIRALESFQVQDGDKIRISPILPYSEKTVYLDGHVFHPGKYPYKEGMKVVDVIKSYSEMLPEPYQRHAEVIRLQAPDFMPTVISFNLSDVMSGKQESPKLQPFDTVRIFSRYDFEDPPVITVSGEVREPGDHRTNGITRLSDAVFLAGGPTPDAEMRDAQIVRRSNGAITVLSANLGKALGGDATENIILQSKDRVIIHRNLAKLDPPSVTIEGQVANPGRYPLGDNMSAVDLVRTAGGLRRGAYTETADLTRYVLENGERVLSEHEEVAIGKALSGVPDTDVRLRDGDVLSIGQIEGWSDIGAFITVKGEVVHPGGFGIEQGERLSSILKRAGGFSPAAYPYGAVLMRKQVRELEEKTRADVLRRIDLQENQLRAMPDGDQYQTATKRVALEQWQSAREGLRNNPPLGRVVIHVTADISQWENTPADITVRAGDVLVVPRKPDYVLVSGQVFNPTAVSFKPGKSGNWYLSQAGGATDMANKKEIFVIRADGSVISGGGSFWGGSSLNAALHPGDMVVVPEKAIKPTPWTNILQIATLLTSVAVAASVIATR